MFGAFRRTFGVFDTIFAAESTLWDGLVEYLPLSETSAGSAPVERVGTYLGTRWTDNNNAASDTGLVHALAAKFVQANTQYLSRTDYRLSLPGSSFTVAAWIKRLESDANGYRGIVTCMSGTTGYELMLTNDSTLVSNIYGADLSQLHNADAGGTALVTGTWHLVRLWYDGTTHYNQKDLGSVASDDVATPVRGGMLRIGIQGSDKYWGGMIGPIMWWNRVLTDAEWSELYNAGSGTSCDDVAAAEWKPTDISGCELWLDAHDLDDTDNLNQGVANSTAVSTWYDKSGNDRDMVQATESAQPLYRTDVPIGTLTYRPSVGFDGGDYLSNASPPANSAGTVFVAFKQSTNNYAALLSVADEASTTRYWLVGPYYDTSSKKLWINQRNADTGDVVNGSTEIANAGSYIFTIVSSGTAYSARINGAAETLSVAGGGDNGDWFADVTGADNIVLCAVKRTSAGLYAKANIGEVIVYDSALSAENIATVEAYLSAKWGIEI